jgi:hypothetical protein
MERIVAVKGNYTHGKKVIDYLEKLGGVNTYNFIGVEEDYYYFIDSDGNIVYNFKNKLERKFPCMIFLELNFNKKIYELWA